MGDRLPGVSGRSPFLGRPMGDSGVLVAAGLLLGKARAPKDPRAVGTEPVPAGTANGDCPTITGDCPPSAIEPKVPKEPVTMPPDIGRAPGKDGAPQRSQAAPRQAAEQGAV